MTQTSKKGPRIWGYYFDPKTDWRQIGGYKAKQIILLRFSDFLFGEVQDLVRIYSLRVFPLPQSLIR